MAGGGTPPHPRGGEQQQTHTGGKGAAKPPHQASIHGGTPIAERWKKHASCGHAVKRPWICHPTGGAGRSMEQPTGQTHDGHHITRFAHAHQTGQVCHHIHHHPARGYGGHGTGVGHRPPPICMGICRPYIHDVWAFVGVCSNTPPHDGGQFWAKWANRGQFQNPFLPAKNGPHGIKNAHFRHVGNLGKKFTIIGQHHAPAPCIGVPPLYAKPKVLALVGFFFAQIAQTSKNSLHGIKNAHNCGQFLKNFCPHFCPNCPIFAQMS